MFLYWCWSSSWCGLWLGRSTSGPGSLVFSFFCSFFSVFSFFFGFFFVLCRFCDLRVLLVLDCVMSAGGSPTWPHCLDCDFLGSVEAWLGGAI